HPAVTPANEQGSIDLSLPVVDGWEAIRRLKSDSALAPIPVIALNAHATSGEEEKARAAGCDDFLTKPIDEDVLFAMLHRWICGGLSQHSLRRPSARRKTLA